MEKFKVSWIIAMLLSFSVLFASRLSVLTRGSTSLRQLFLPNIQMFRAWLGLSKKMLKLLLNRVVSIKTKLVILSRWLSNYFLGMEVKSLTTKIL